MSGFILNMELLDMLEVEAATLDKFIKLFKEELKKLNKGKTYDLLSGGMVLLKKYLETVPAELLQEKFKDSRNLWRPVIESLNLFNLFLVYFLQVFSFLFRNKRR